MRSGWGQVGWPRNIPAQWHQGKFMSFFTLLFWVTLAVDLLLCPCSIGRLRTPLAPALKKRVALQATW
jgi:hypothetical protein